jgi:hypothetical protein
MRKVHFIEGDTGSLYYAVSEDPEKDCHQGFEHVIKDEAFYKENVHKLFLNLQLGTAVGCEFQEGGECDIYDTVEVLYPERE